MDRSRHFGRALLLTVFGSLAFGSGCATFPTEGGGILNEEIDAVISEPPLDQTNWGIRIVDPDRGQILYSRHGHRKFIPASNMKLLSTATALSLLGPAYQYRTSLWAIGTRMEDGEVLEGDLVLAATGDPTLSERFYPSAEAPLDSLAEGIWRSGIRRVTGSLVADVSLWDSTTVPGTWEVDDLPAAYGATGGAFSLAEGILTIEVTAGAEPGLPAQVRWWPWVDGDFLSASFVTVAEGDSTRPRREVAYLPESGRLRISGRVPLGEVDTLRISQRDPVHLASRALLHALEQRGIQIDGGQRIAWDRGEPLGQGTCITGMDLPFTAGNVEPSDPLQAQPDRMAQARFASCPDAALLTTLESPPMEEVIQAILEPSQNWMAEQLVRTLGWELGQEGSWREGFRVEREFLNREVGIDTLDLVFRDGSGLSAKNLVTPRGIVQILDYMRHSDEGGIFRNALASPGEEGSTLENRMEGLETRVFAKTGTITHVASLSGYIYTRSGRALIFTILANGTGLPSRPVREGIDRIVEVLAGY